ncbi:hypothetical protein CISG_09704 [Coccidioides immitis RMSCC 3703]|uniref:Uncharacterized protein n=1 Tax=Coccidioides immitis RMSCC 3703 TaxID=454286 RepID=A0A0J8QKD2_COCIT|nr:hypothetical protein CISG_09704 [Coccidioides immitis RMSCC 3703]
MAKKYSTKVYNSQYHFAGHISKGGINTYPAGHIFARSADLNPRESRPDLKVDTFNHPVHNQESLNTSRLEIARDTPASTYAARNWVFMQVANFTVVEPSILLECG